jgi:ATP-dependent helicase/nuclease subunit B
MFDKNPSEKIDQKPPQNIFQKPLQNIYQIPGRFSFVEALAQGIMSKYGSDPLVLSEILILLPNQRTVKSLRDAFLKISDGRSIILPDMRAVGLMDEDQLVMESGLWSDNAEEGMEEADLPPAVPPFIRQMILMDIITRWYKGRGDSIPEMAQCATLAGALGQFLDQVQGEELDFDDLEELVPEEYAAHWQQTLDFLKILTQSWPDILLSTGYMDSAHRHNYLVNSLCQNWAKNPPQTPVIMAGSNGATKAIQKLLSAVTELPCGMVILTGADLELDQESWDVMEATHPQFAMKKLFSLLGVMPKDVKDWTDFFSQSAHEVSESPPMRAKILSEIMRPARVTDMWRNIPKKFKSDQISQAFKGVEIIVTSSVREEAGIIAMLLREALECEGKTAALVTPDRQLARRVQGEMSRWDIKIDDSAGTPFFNSRAGLFLRLTAQMVAEKFSPVPLLSALKHPLISAGMQAGYFRKMLRRLDKDILRGGRPDAGTNGVKRAITAHFNDPYRKTKDRGQEMLQWWDDLSDIMTPFENLMIKKSCSFEDLLIGHITMAENLCAKLEGGELIDGDQILWKKEDGEAAAKFIEDMHGASEYLSNLNPEEYPALFEVFMSNLTVRAKYGQHPRLNIWGPLEGRLQHADLVILSGLNEGTWPPEAASDPWMSRPMRQKFGLPSPEEKIGLSAHDFTQAFSAPKVILTRSEKMDGTESVKSRWLSRMEAVLGAVSNSQILKSDGVLKPEFGLKYIQWHQNLDAPEEEIKIMPPNPMPPVKDRPRSLSVSAIQNWMKDPYSLYASRILNLYPLKDLDMAPSAADKGTIIHDVLDEFMKNYRHEMPHDAVDKLLEIGKEKFEEIMDRPSVMAFWWPRFTQIAEWFVRNEQIRRAAGHKTMATECSGEMTFSSTAGPFTLKAKADRIDRLAEGGYAIIDYKTGGAPTAREIHAGYAPQLPLESLLARGGHFKEFPEGLVSELAYWKLSGGKKIAEIKSFCETAKSKVAQMDVMAVTDNASQGLKELVKTFDQQTTPYLNNPRPDALGYGDYDHLARTKEWTAQNNEEPKIQKETKVNEGDQQ